MTVKPTTPAKGTRRTNSKRPIHIYCADAVEVSNLARGLFHRTPALLREDLDAIYDAGEFSIADATPAPAKPLDPETATVAAHTAKRLGLPYYGGGAA